MLGERIKKLREEKNLKQEELAKILSVSPSTIGMYEINKREPNNELILRLADFFSVSTDYLLGKSNLRNYDEDEQEFRFAYHKEIEGMTDEEVKDALRFYKEMKKKVQGNNDGTK